MSRKLTFGTITTPKPLKLWQPTEGHTILHWLPGDKFEAAARLHGYSPGIGAFAVWGRWWKKDEIYLHANRVDLLVHEMRHIEEQRNFHG